MRPIAQNIFPGTKIILERLGKKIKNKRKLLGLTIIQVACRTQASRSTITLIEKGTPGVSLGTYLQVMRVLGFLADLEIIATENMDDHIRLHRLLKGKV